MNITNETKDKYKALINEGLTTYQMADKLNVSASTVKRHLRMLKWRTLKYVPSTPADKNEMENMVKQNYSTYQIASKMGKSQGYVKHWLKKYCLKTSPVNKYGNNTSCKIIQGDTKACPKCKRVLKINNENFYIKKNGKAHAWCRNCNDEITYQKQISRKQKCVEYKGGKCSLCGYNQYIGALDFHHIDPTQKTFNISNLRSYTWNVLKKELDKCVCLCKNCHAEIHGGIKKLVGSVGLEPTTGALNLGC